jgi:large subunit ribosomal protein L35
MPKVKTHSGAKKRFKKTATGKFKFGGTLKRHLLTNGRKKRKRQLPATASTSAPAQHHQIEAMLPYGAYKDRENCHAPRQTRLQGPPSS